MRPLIPLAVGALILVCLWVAWDREPNDPLDVTAEEASGTTYEPAGPLRGRAGDAALDGSGGRVVDEARPLLAPGQISLRGRVLTFDRAPVVGAEVRVGPWGTEGAARVTQTDATGTYTVALGESPREGYVSVRIAARDGQGRVGSASVALGPGSPITLRAPDVLVAEPQRLRIRVHREGRVVPSARVVVAARAFGRHTVLAEGETTLEGLFVAEDLPPGALQLFASAKGHGRGVRAIQLPREDDDLVDVALSLERTLVVEVVDASGVGVSGAQVFLSGPHARGAGGVEMRMHALEPLPRTDAEGRVVLRGLPAGESLRIAAWAEGYARPNPYLGQGRTPVPSEAEEITLTLGRHRTLRLPLKRNAVTPKPGTPLRIEVQSWMAPFLSTTARAEVTAGYVLLEGAPLGWCSGRVVAPSGAWARFNLPRPTPVDPDPAPGGVVFRQGRVVRVRLEQDDGSPLAGAAIRIGGAQRFGDDARRLTTDAAGEVDVEAFGSATGSIRLLPGGMGHGGQDVGEVDFNSDVPVQVFRVPTPASLAIEVLLGNGRPGLPQRFEVSVDGITKTPSEIEEDALGGELRIQHRMPEDTGTVKLTLRAVGYLPFETVVEAGERRPARARLVPAGALTVDVWFPEDGAFQLALERETDVPGAFSAAPDQMLPRDSAPAEASGETRGSHTFEGLHAGRYRVRDRTSGETTDAIEVRLGEDTPRLVLDLAGARWVEGEVRAPADADLSRAWVEVLGEMEAGARGPQGLSRVRQTPVGPDGRFRFRANRAATQAVVVRHPLLAPAEQGGQVALSGGIRSIVLVLEAGAEVRFSLPREVPTGVEPRVLLEPVGGGATESYRPVLEGTQWRFGGFPHGTYTVWVDMHRGVPVQRRITTTTGDGVRDLGLLRADAGATVTVRTVGGSGLERVPLSVAVRVRGVFTYRRANFRPPGSTAAVVVAGVGPGEVLVRVERMSGPPAKRLVLEREIEIDAGKTAIEIVLGADD